MRTAAEWTYLRIGVESIEAGDRLLREVVTPVMRMYEASALSDPRWFFLRYLDATGLHIRLRVHDRDPDRLARIDGALRREVVGLGLRRREAVRYLEDGYYVPEWAKWDGADGVRRAEGVFGFSSRYAVEQLDGDRAARRVRGLVLLDAATAVVPGETVRSFLYYYAWYWSGGNTAMLPRTRPRIRAHADRLGEQLLEDAAAVRPSIMADPAYARYADRLAQDVSRGARPWARLFNHVHLTANRLGLTTPEEAVLAEVLLRDGHGTTGSQRDEAGR